MAAVTGIDSSTQSCKVVVRDLDTGAVLRTAGAPHPTGSEVDPAAWWTALDAALRDADGLGADVVALSIAAQQHGMVALDAHGDVVRPALLWNDTRSAGAAEDLVAELGPAAWADATGSVPLAAFTVAKLRWFAEHEPDLAARTAAICLPHDWLSWRLRAGADITMLRTDRGDASGTGYWSPATGEYRRDLLERAFGGTPLVPEVLDPWALAGPTGSGVPVGAGTGDNMAAALGLGARVGDVIVSLGTSGVVSTVTQRPVADPSGTIAGFADAAGGFLPLACTLNGAPVLTKVAELLGCTLEQLSDLALSAPAGADGLTLVPYLEGERTPNLPDARGELVGMTLANTTAANLARAAVEGLLCGLADGIDALVARGARVDRVLLVGGGARSAAVREIAATVFDAAVEVPAPAEHVALGAGVQAARALRSGAELGWAPPAASAASGTLEPRVREQYAIAAQRTARG